MSNHKKYNSFNIIIGILLIIIYTSLVPIINNLLPRNFRVDSLAIKRISENTGLSFTTGESYQSTALFFKMIGYNSRNDSYFEIMLSICTYMIYIFLLIFVFKIDFRNLRNILSIICITFFFSIYFSVLSKDLICFLFLFIPFCRINKTDFLKYFVFFSFVYGLFIRSYWILFVIFFFFLNYVCKKVKWKILGTGFLYISISFLYVKIKGDYISKLRADTHSVLNANTNIDNIFIPNNLFHDLLNNLYVFLNLIFPANGIGSKNEIFYYIFIYFFIILLFKYYNLFNDRKYFNILFSFLIIQSLFEPDMGSALRHQSVFYFYIFLFLCNKVGVRRKNELFSRSFTL